MGVNLSTNEYGLDYPAGTSTFAGIFPAGLKAIVDSVGRALEAAKWLRPPLPATAGYLDTLSVTGLYPVLSATTATTLGLPSPAMGHVQHLHATTTYARQLWFPQVSREVFARDLNNGTWALWYSIGQAQGIVPALKDFDALKQPGVHTVQYTNHPNQPLAKFGFLEVQWMGAGRYYQKFTTNEVVPQIRERVTAVEGWNAWTDPRQDTGATALEHEVRLSQLRTRTGQVTVTTPAAVTIVMDHGLANFGSIIWPLLQARNLPVTLAINSNKWSDPLNAGYTATNVKAWVDTGLLEVANHGRNHLLNGGASDVDEIEGGRADLESQVGVPVDTWIQTGNGTYDFADGNAPEKYWTTRTGRAVLRSHGVATGLVPHTTKLYDLDGTPKIGANGFWIDDGATTAQAQVDAAIAQGKGAIIRFHPQMLNTTGKLTTAQLTSFLDYLKGKVDAGQLTVLTYRKWAVAESQRSTLSVVDQKIAAAATKDTGWRDVTSLATSGLITAGNVYLRRTGTTVWLIFRNVQLSSRSVWQNVFQLPTGFRPEIDMRLTQATSSNSMGNDRIDVYTFGTVYLTGHTDATDAMNFQLSFPTALTFPATYPGTPA